eukprot:Gb_35108 [translate_table: standard]
MAVSLHASLPPATLERGTSTPAHKRVLSSPKMCKIRQMKKSRDTTTEFDTYGSHMEGYINAEALAGGKVIHAYVIKTGLDSDIFQGTKLVHMYGKCGSLVDARKVFDKMADCNVVSWNTMIAGYVENGEGEEALKLFHQMQWAHIKLSKFTASSVLKACTILSALQAGKEVHAHVIRINFESDVFVGSGLIDMYSKCGSAKDAHNVFGNMSERNVISWNVMIAGYSQNGYGEQALKLFWQMQEVGIKPNQFVFSSVIGVCSSLALMEQGKQVHAQVVKTGFESSIFVGSALIDIYAKYGNIEDAHIVLDKMPLRDVVLWTSMITGYAQQGQNEEALNLFCQMHRKLIKPNQFTFSSVLRSCASLAGLEQGRQIHAHIIKSRFESDVSVGNSLVTMYARCGSIEDAQNVFDAMPSRNVVSWNAMISGFAQHGYAKEALKLFEQMQCAEVKLNHITFVGVLSACSHGGLVDEGRYYFDSMNRDHCIRHRMEHYACMVDLLGRAGNLDEAEDFINKIPVESSALVWRTLLGACRVHANLDLGKRAAQALLELDPKDSAAYVLLSSIYAIFGRWDDVAKVRKMMKDGGVEKELGRSWIKVKNRVYEFIVEDRSHPQTDQIYAKLEELTRQMEEAGYVPDTSFVLHDVEQDKKVSSLSHHCEKLAIVFGLISTPPKASIRVFKNLRVCGDCHTATKFISKITAREIIVRDANRFHHFKGGELLPTSVVSWEFALTNVKGAQRQNC